MDSPLLWNGEGSFHDILLHITQVVEYKRSISIYLGIMYSEGVPEEPLQSTPL